MHLPTFLLISLLSLINTTLAIPTINLSFLIPRQTAPPARTSCFDYSETANYTAIGTNATLRGAFIQSSPLGTDPTRVTLDDAMKRYTALNMLKDERLNRECGNLTTVALREVGRNFSNGIVGPFKVTLTKVTFAKEGGAISVKSLESVGVMLLAGLVGCGVMVL
jgi:hypothetical protein